MSNNRYVLRRKDRRGLTWDDFGSYSSIELAQAAVNAALVPKGVQFYSVQDQEKNVAVAYWSKASGWINMPAEGWQK